MGENINTKKQHSLSSEVATRVQAEAKWVSFLNSAITLRVETAAAGFNSPTHTYASVQFEPHVNLERNKSMWIYRSLSV